MKKLCILGICLFIFGSIMTQTPQKMSYQAVIRNNTNQLIVNQDIGMQVSILQGSIFGASVYVERQTPASNANGLVTIEIGAGTPIFGDFSSIDWSEGPFYLKTETDPTGGNIYSITGTSQFLSVPYALYARSAENLDGMINEDQVRDLKPYLTAESDPLFSDFKASRTLSINGITHNLTANRSWTVGTITSLSTTNGITGGPVTGTGTIGLTGQALDLHNLNENGFFTRASRGTIEARVLVAGSGITISNHDGMRGNPTISAQTFQIGDFAYGGIVFWLDATGQHGIVCAKSDQTIGVEWWGNTPGLTYATGDGPLAGKMNTIIIIAATVAIGNNGQFFAARIANEEIITEDGIKYGDWYLPSKEELYLIYSNRTTINTTATAHGGTSLANASYWSSTEIGEAMAWSHNFITGLQISSSKGAMCRVRAVRSF